MPTEELALLLQDARDLRIVDDHAQTQVVSRGGQQCAVRPPQGVRRAYAVNAQATGDVVGTCSVDSRYPRSRGPDSGRAGACADGSDDPCTTADAILAVGLGWSCDHCRHLGNGRSVGAGRRGGRPGTGAGNRADRRETTLSQARVDVEADDGLPVGL